MTAVHATHRGQHLTCMHRSFRLLSRVSLSSMDGRRAHTGRSWCSSPVSSTLEPGVPMDSCRLLARCGDPNGHSLCRKHSLAHTSGSVTSKPDTRSISHGPAALQQAYTHWQCCTEYGGMRGCLGVSVRCRCEIK
jgi:hypothetical protein